ncbi:MAG: FHA domain-containing protein [Proteobacteria bacterium]|nr:FHA domain-containing protein [Pseudomonadota bacterium]MBS0509340.1 FHA domain-containing protein [Pseudomonadota bacterium]
MPKMVVAIDGVVIKEVALTQERTTVGRRPYNDVVIDNLAVSGEHAVFVMSGDEVLVHDLGSTNGTYVNGKPIKQQSLRNGDIVEMGKYKIRFQLDAPVSGYDKAMAFAHSMPAGERQGPLSAPAPLGGMSGVVRVVTGPAAGREVALTKVVTTIGKPGVAVASITKRHHNFVLAHVDGAQLPLLNGLAIGADPVALKHGDRIALAGAEMEFVQV